MTENYLTIGFSLDAEMAAITGDAKRLAESALLQSISVELLKRGCIKIEDQGIIDGRREFVGAIICDPFPEGLALPKGGKQ